MQAVCSRITVYMEHNFGPSTCTRTWGTIDSRRNGRLIPISRPFFSCAALKTSDPIRRLAYDTVLAVVDGDDRAQRQLFSVMGIDNLKAAPRTRAAVRDENGVPPVCKKKASRGVPSRVRRARPIPD